MLESRRSLCAAAGVSVAVALAVPVVSGGGHMIAVAAFPGLLGSVYATYRIERRFGAVWTSTGGAWNSTMGGLVGGAGAFVGGSVAQSLASPKVGPFFLSYFSWMWLTMIVIYGAGMEQAQSSN
jgi:hypothetical protein